MNHAPRCNIAARLMAVGLLGGSIFGFAGSVNAQSFSVNAPDLVVSVSGRPWLHGATAVE